MTVEAYLRSLVMGLEFTAPVLERCARSPKEVNLESLKLDEDIEDAMEDEDIDVVDYQKRLDYASSTLYYAVLGVFTGGGYSEQVGDVQISQNNFQITQADRERYKMLADMLRKKWGFEVLEIDITGVGMFDASSLRQRPKNPRQWQQ